VAGQRQVGRASVGSAKERVNRERGKTYGTPRTTHTPHTSIISVPAPPPPVFVDDSGRRHRRLRTTLYVVACLIIVAALTFWISVSVAPLYPEPISTCTSGEPASSSGCAR
jgi:hypothetical protein